MNPVFLMFFSFICCGMEVFFDGSKLFIKDTEVKKYASYKFNNNYPDKLTCSQNWFVLDKQLQEPYFHEPKLLAAVIGNENQKETKSILSSIKKKLCSNTLIKFISGEKEAKDFDINNCCVQKDYYKYGNTTGITLDGVQHTDDGYTHYLFCRHDYKDFEMRVYHGFSEKNKNPSELGALYLNLERGIDCALALHYPYSAWAVMPSWKVPLLDQEEKPYFCFKDLASNDQVKKSKLPCGIKKMAWLKGKNLLALTQDGEIVTIDASQNPCQLFEQKFGDLTFSDIAVDMKNPWRFIALTTNFNLIYADLSLQYINDYKIKPKKTYKVLIKLNLVLNFNKDFKIWFYGNKIGVKSIKQDIEEYLDVYELKNNLIVINKENVDLNSNKCLELAAKK